MRRFICCFIFLCFLHRQVAHATIFGQVQGIVHDPQHRPVSGARITLRAVHSDFMASRQTNQDGSFRLPAIPLGEYVVTVSQTGFSTLEQNITLASNTSPILHFELRIGGVKESVTVSTQSGKANVDSVTPTTLIGRIDIAQTPGADRTNGLQMITDYVPGAYITHDMLHVRGGHQVSWQIDGVQIPNTNIASNLGAQIDPKDIDYLEVQRGSYTSDVGDRTYGVFNVVPRTGFERNHEGELILSLGSFFQTNDQVNFGSHTEKFAYYASLNGNRSDYGLSPPVAQVHHDAANGYGGFGSLIYNRTPRDQFRLITQLRTDYFQIPYDPDPNSAENQQYNSSGLRDGQHETDGIVDFTWAHSFSASTLLQVSPFYHSNRADYEPDSNDLPVATTSDRASHYAGVQASLTGQIAHNTLQAGFYAFGQHDNYRFGSIFNDGSYPNFKINDSATGGVIEEFISDNYKVTPWLTLIAGLRQSHFSGSFSEDATSPRVGVAIQVPKLNWVFRGFYGRFYQPPPLLTATCTTLNNSGSPGSNPSCPTLDYANSQNTTFAPLHGERDEEHQFGVQIPFHGWLLDADTFKTRAKNFLDHSNLGESSIYYPVAIDGALIRGWELTLRSPPLWHGGQAHLAYSNQIGEQRGAITGGLVCYPIASPGCGADLTYSPVDHDQRNTLNVGYNTSLPFRAFASTNVSYGSGFHNGSPNAQYPGDYLPQHTTFDLSLGKSIGDRTTVSVNALNVGNRRTLLDNSLTFGGFHYNDPREIYGEVRFRFHY
jgi:TonB dependent receptor/Carboxypeptidase regulatory-like domain/TonB-dependent Receptor Plug Domain